MRKIMIVLCLICFLNGIAQSKEHSGNYTHELGEGDHIETNKLTLNPNGTFLFHWYRKIESTIPNGVTKYGKGSWTSNKRLILLKVEDSDVDATHVLNLNNSRLRYDTKSPRDKSDRDIKTSVRFIDSEVFWLKGRTLIKEE